MKKYMIGISLIIIAASGLHASENTTKKTINVADVAALLVGGVGIGLEGTAKGFTGLLEPIGDTFRGAGRLFMGIALLQIANSFYSTYKITQK